MYYIGNVFRINGPIGTCMRTGLAADAAHIVPDKQLVLLSLLLQCLDRACGNTVRILASATDKKIGSKLCYGNNPVVGRMVEVAALYLALLTLSRTADVEIDE
jgi:hypothetical protein